MSHSLHHVSPNVIDPAPLPAASDGSTGHRVHLSGTHLGVERRCVLYADVEISAFDRDALTQQRGSLQQQHGLQHASMYPSLKVLEVSVAELDALLSALRSAAERDNPPGNELLHHDGVASRWTSQVSSLQRLLRDCRLPFHDVNELTACEQPQPGESVDPVALARFRREWKSAMAARPFAYWLPATLRFHWQEERVVPFSAKVDLNGRYCSFPGLSVVAMAAPDGRLSCLYQRLQQSPISQYFSPLPPSSYHVTVSDGVVKHRNPHYEQQRKQALQALSPLQQQMRHTGRLQCHVLGGEMGNVIALKVRFRSAQQPAVDALRRSILAALGQQYSAAVFHITLGYRYQQQTAHDELMPAFKQLLAEVFSGAPKLQLEAPDVVIFESMEQFEPVVCLPVSCPSVAPSCSSLSSSPLSTWSPASASIGSVDYSGRAMDSEAVSVSKNALNVVVVLDRSGSMEAVRQEMVVSLNAFTHSQQQQQRQFGSDARDTRVSLLQFSAQFAFTFLDRPLLQCPVITEDDYVLGGSTALYDALGRVLDAFDGCRDCILAIITDGQDNCSSRCTRADIAARIAHKRQLCGWDVHYLCADAAGFAEGQALGMTSAMQVRGAALPTSVSTTLSAAISTSRSLRTLPSALSTASTASAGRSPRWHDFSTSW